jgi:hypothetical protein
MAKTKRSKLKYPALTKGYNSRVRQEYSDFDYLDQLNEEELVFLNKFVEEEMNASFKKDGTDFNKTDEERRAIYNKNNARNRCLYGRQRNRVGATKMLNYEDSIDLIELENEINTDYIEDTMIEYMDSLNQSAETGNSTDNGNDSGNNTK